MERMNGYFYLIIKFDGTYLCILPPVNGGRAVTYDDVFEYLQSKRIFEYDKFALNAAIVRCMEKTEVKLNTKIILPEHAYVKIRITEDRLQAIGTFYAPSNNGNVMTKDEILKDLAQAGVRYGILEEVIDDYITNPVYCTEIVLAKAILPIEGKSAKIEYHFNTDISFKPKKNEDGSVDFHKLDMINHVEQGDVLATLTPADFGTTGYDVTGKILKPNRVENKFLRPGNKAHLSEDGLQLIADVNGHVTLAGGKVYVSDTYEINGDVDTSTGDITYAGNVYVKGSVITGFQIHAVGDVIVDGVVEGALIEAQGQIILKRGIQGMNRGKLVAGSNIVAKFIENATVQAGGYVNTEAILHSKVSAKNDVIVGGKKGYVTGGQIRSGTMIQVKTAGSTMGTNTSLEVGVDPMLVEEYYTLEKDMNSIQTEIFKVQQIIELFEKKFGGRENIPSDRIVTYISAKETYEKFVERQAKSKARYYELSTLMESNENGYVRVEGIIYPGCKIVVSNVIYYVRKDIMYSKFIREGADIKVLPF